MDRKRSYGESSASVLSKKPKTMPFTPSSFLRNKVHVGDRSVMICGYIEDIRQIGKDRWRFILNNNDKCRVKCFIRDFRVRPIKHLLIPYKIIVLGMAKAMKLTDKDPSCLQYELWHVVGSYIEAIGFHHNEAVRSMQVTPLERIPSEHGIIKTEGYLQQQFVFHKPDELLGCITDLENKVEIVIPHTEIVEFAVGSLLSVTGEICDTFDKCIYLHVQNIDQIQVKKDGVKLEKPEEFKIQLMMGGEILRRRDINHN